MQKVIQRTKAAQRQASRRLKKGKEHIERGQAFNRREEAQRLRRYNNSLIVDARKARNEDWALGPLAPRRDVGDQADSYGTIPIFNFSLPDKNPNRRPKWFHISEGDRVVVVNGREKGKIGVVNDLNKDKVSVQIRDINMADVSVPAWAQSERSMEPMVAMPIHIPLSDVRLVYPLPDPETGVPHDVVIERLSPVDRQWDRVKKEWDDGQRLIAGTNTIIPWPEKLPPEYEDHDVDTLRISVEEDTFRPYLLNPPMPLSVIDELRNKYSKFRTRHDWEYVQKKEAEDARSEKRKELGKTMRTPLQELKDVREKEKALKEKELSDEQLARIGEVIERERARAMGAAREMA